MIVNVMHRPSAGRLYEMFRLQQNIAHELGLKVTVMMPYDFMLNERALADVRADVEGFGDEVGIWMGETTTEKLSQRVHCKEAFLWLLKEEAKKRVLEEVVGKFKEVFGYAPASFAAYHMDAFSLSYLKKICPQMKISVAGCFEEGVKVFHGCNNSWYLFNEGMPFFPWYPAAENSLRPAENRKEWCGIVAVPHLARDLALSYEGRNDFFASHPANVQRAMANNGPVAPYVKNLLDVYRFQERLNNGFSYTNVFVGANWLSQSPNVQDSDEITQGLYREYLTYFAKLRSEGKLQDMRMSEFADWFTENVPVGEPQLFDAKEILYGSGKDYVWFCDSAMRVTFDICQNGSIGDLRPFVARQPRCTGVDTPNGAYGTNPYLIHSQYRTGLAHHFEDGARTTFFLSDGKQTYDIAEFRGKIASVKKTGKQLQLKLAPLRLSFESGSVTLQTQITAGEGRILLKRSLLENTTGCEITGTEYVKACHGITEYPEDLRDVTLALRKLSGETLETFPYSYEGLEKTVQGEAYCSAVCGSLETELSVWPVRGEFISASVSEGYLFNPYYTLKLGALLHEQSEMETVICMKKSR